MEWNKTNRMLAIVEKMYVHSFGFLESNVENAEYYNVCFEKVKNSSIFLEKI